VEFLTETYQAVGLDRSVLPPLLSRKHTKANALAIADMLIPRAEGIITTASRLPS
jgi:hypothetical protein